MKRLLEMRDRRCRGEPLQYTIGSWSFRGIDLMIDPRVLIPRPETEWVVEVALEEAARVGLKRVQRRPAFDGPTTAVVADLGTGSGAIAIALETELAGVEVWATDLHEDALAVATANIAGCAATRIRVAKGSWFDALPAELKGCLAMIVANPPYVAMTDVAGLPADVRDYEPRHALVPGPTGLEALDHLIDNAIEWMCEPAALVCEIAPTQVDAVLARASAAGFTAAFVRDDLAGRPRVLVGRRG